MNQADIQAPVAIVTGGARRIGAAIAVYLHQAGYKVAIHYHQSASEARALADKCNEKRPNSAYLICADLCSDDASHCIINETITWAGQLDLLVNNASVFTRTILDQFNNKDWDNLFHTNVKAPFRLSQCAYSHLAAQQGCIINITDSHVDYPLKDYAVYNQTKAALSMQTKALAREFAPLVRVNEVAPGAISWPEGDNRLTTARKNNLIEQTPLKRHGEPLFIAQAVLALAQNTFITGQRLLVDGGRHLV